MRLEEILELAIELGASDTYVTANALLSFRVKGLVTIMKDPKKYLISARDADTVVTELKSTTKALRDLYEPDELDGSYKFESSNGKTYYFRYNVSLAGKEPHITIRKLIDEIPSIEQIKMDRGDGLKFFNECMKQKEGIYLVIGATGSGKSTTLTCIVDALLNMGGLKAITLEDPIEYRYDALRYEPKDSIIIQREVNVDTKSFDRGLRAAMRQNPDIILLGEIRDKETASAALQAANTGHQVLATLHAADVDLAVSRIKFLVGNITNDFSFVRAIMSQKLERIDGEIQPIRVCKVDYELDYTKDDKEVLSETTL